MDLRLTALCVALEHHTRDDNDNDNDDDDGTFDAVLRFLQITPLRVRQCARMLQRRGSSSMWDAHKKMTARRTTRWHCWHWGTADGARS